MFGILKKIFGTAQDRTIKKYAKIVDTVNQWDETYKALSDEELQKKTEEFRKRLTQGETLDAILPEAYGVVKNCCRRLCGKEMHVSGYNQKWDMIPYDVQVIGAIAMHNGTIAEMMTGEGKTLTAAMPLYLNALTGKPVHLVTVNDYLANRDCEWVGSIFRFLGLSVSALTTDIPPHQRLEIYQSDIVYGTASEFGFDYLRDNSMALSKQEQVQRGYFFAIIDEIDSILIDEARTPLIISGPSSVSRQMYDTLKGGVYDLVRKQKDTCHELALSAKKTIESLKGVEKLSKEQQKLVKGAYKDLWRTSKGMPRNKILKKLYEDPEIRARIDEEDLYYHSEQGKNEKTEALSSLYMIVDERNNDFELTEKGIQEWIRSSQTNESEDDFVMLDISHEYIKIDQNSSLSEEEKMERKLSVQEEDAKRKERSHNLRQLLRAHLLMEKDVDYIIDKGKIVIIDENTGRPQPGRRFSEGLHQAIEAKEGLEIQKETQTYATVTLQNYFRMYEKLAGMTGTASTEASEFKQIYNLEVLQIPTHKPCRRVDSDDEVYMTEREKYQAILKEIEKVNKQGRPLLIGTESVDVSEKLSRILKMNKMEHTTLNAKNHEREAEIIANAGQKGAITIATNMAGRGTDIKLQEGVAEAGGLYVLGTTRHPSRRIDRQLRGRCARQGDPGSSKFYLSFEDSLLRLFASGKMTSILQRFRPPEGEPISAPILSRSIETAQKRVEQRNYMIRKTTLEYDDVMNKQRQAIYGLRNEVLWKEDVLSLAQDSLKLLCEEAKEKYFVSRSQEGGWDPEGFRRYLQSIVPLTFNEELFDDDYFEAEEHEQTAASFINKAFEEKIKREKEKLPAHDPKRPHPVFEAMRNLMLRKIDQLWQEHLLGMDHLRSDVMLRSVAQKDPLVEFKHDAYELFMQLIERIHEETAHDLFRFEIIVQERSKIEELLSSMQLSTNQARLEENLSSFGPLDDDKVPLAETPNVVSPKALRITSEEKAGRNDPCPCGSGKKYKQCCEKELKRT